ncbi:MAG: hypothetical protein HOP95_04725 [Sphingomonas sp.]|nr:hypothetical protein [Sphingomonas sp.]
MFAFSAALALIAAQSPAAAGTPVESNLEYAKPVAGNWVYATASDGSSATFDNLSGQPQLTIRCTRSTRHVAILKNSPIASPSLWIWTSSQTKTLPATYDASSGRVRVDVGAYDPLLDAIASSRGRIGFSTSGLAALVVPPWADVARVIEDCRA